MPDGDQIVSNTHMTRVKGETTLTKALPGSISAQALVLFKVRR